MKIALGNPPSMSLAPAKNPLPMQKFRNDNFLFARLTTSDWKCARKAGKIECRDIISEALEVTPARPKTHTEGIPSCQSVSLSTTSSYPPRRLPTVLSQPFP